MPNIYVDYLEYLYQHRDTYADKELENRLLVDVVEVKKQLIEKENNDKIMKIIKDKQVNMGLLIHSIHKIEQEKNFISIDALNWYNNIVDNWKRLDVDEFFLLKEWLK